MTGVTALEKTLIGVEALAGSSTDTVTTHWRGMGKVQDRREIVFLRDPLPVPLTGELVPDRVQEPELLHCIDARIGGNSGRHRESHLTGRLLHQLEHRGSH